MAQAETTSTHTGVSLDFYMVILDPESEWPLTVITVRPEAPWVLQYSLGA